ncbi:uncharacterized protein LOC106071034 isoform X2 [Biomphalaria glabrata]|uniref:Uncharacterized protein LOC106071034 isoform X2 n=1 Tax=Biomphalaria glabrata TaxID=6526 RepID=A0A9W3BCB4_BIOGL|nr:uncharacterized protein LOC106071034 isoform X2 [Biomphalaria glabrata]
MSSTSPRGEEGLIEKFPHYKTYKACQSQALMSSSFALLMASMCSYLAMNAFNQRFKPNINKNWLVAGPVLFGVLSAYVVVQHKTTNCQNMWMAMEEKHSVLTPASDAL